MIMCTITHIDKYYKQSHISSSTDRVVRPAMKDLQVSWFWMSALVCCITFSILVVCGLWTHWCTVPRPIVSSDSRMVPLDNRAHQQVTWYSMQRFAHHGLRQAYIVCLRKPVTFRPSWASCLYMFRFWHTMYAWRSLWWVKRCIEYQVTCWCAQSSKGTILLSTQHA